MEQSTDPEQVGLLLTENKRKTGGAGGRKEEEEGNREKLLSAQHPMELAFCMVLPGPSRHMALHIFR